MQNQDAKQSLCHWQMLCELYNRDVWLPLAQRISTLWEGLSGDVVSTMAWAMKAP